MPVGALLAPAASREPAQGPEVLKRATLPNGFLVERIAPGELLVMRDGQRQVLGV